MTDIDLARRRLLAGAAMLGGSALGACGTSSPLASASAASPGASGRYDAEVVVVGAGFAGLMAARSLAAAGRNVLLVEADSRVGGRIRNYNLTAAAARPGTIVEIGGQWVGPTQDVVLNLISELGLSTFKTYNDGNYLDYRNGLSMEYGHLLPVDPTGLGLNRIPPTDPAGAAEAGAVLALLNDMARQVPLDRPWTAPSARSWDSMTMQTWMDQNMVTPGGKALVELAVQAVFSAEPRDLSFLHVLFYVHSAGSMDNLINTADGAQDSRVVGGTQLIALRMAEQLGTRVLLNSPVSHIEQSAGEVIVGSADFQVHAQRAIVAVPPALAARIRYAPALPGLRDQLTQRMPMGTVIKVQCVYPTPFWRDAGLAGQVTSDTGPVKITFDNSPPDAHIGVMMGFIEGADGRVALGQMREQRMQAVIDSFVRYFGEDARHPLEYVEQSWADEEWTRGCYAGYFAPGVWLDFGAALREPIGRIHWAGTETAEIWNGYMDGALRSGLRAADEVRAAL